jgi:hypothetical protein
MTTKALDLVTMGHALSELSATYLGDCQWQSVNDEQWAFLEWYRAHRDEIGKLSGLEALASTDYAVLNSFLKARGFVPQFRPFDGVGVASILDMLVEWLSKGTPTTVRRYDRSLGEHGGYVTYPAFRIMAGGVDILDVAGFDQPLVRLRTTTGHSLWLMKADEPATGIELAYMAQKLLATHHSPNPYWTVGVKVPMVEMDVRPDLSWMLGANTVSPTDGYHEIAQAFQQFKLRANEKGARVKVMTGFAARRGGPSGPVPYGFDEPFIGFFTQPGHDTLPMAAFWADTDVWQNPEGTLEEL